VEYLEKNSIKRERERERERERDLYTKNQEYTGELSV
jgi:hypothetical protein